MFWMKKYDPNIIIDIDINLIYNFFKKNNSDFECELNNDWWYFGYYYGVGVMGWEDLVSKSFANMVSGFITGEPVTCGVELYFDEDKIDNKLLIEYNKLKTEKFDEVVKVKLMFNKIVEVYENIEKFEIKNKRLEFRLTKRQYDKFMSLDGNNKTEKFIKLLYGA